MSLEYMGSRRIPGGRGDDDRHGRPKAPYPTKTFPSSPRSSKGGLFVWRRHIIARQQTSPLQAPSSPTHHNPASPASMQRKGGRGTAGHLSRLKPAEVDPLAEYGLPSKGEKRCASFPVVYSPVSPNPFSPDPDSSPTRSKKHTTPRSPSATSPSALLPATETACRSSSPVSPSTTTTPPPPPNPA